jgi:hypothetical protein
MSCGWHSPRLKRRWGASTTPVKTQALRVIDDGVGLKLWAEAGAKDLARRKGEQRLEPALAASRSSS